MVLDRKTIEAAQELRFIGVLATGVNVVDVEAARERGIPVCNVPAYSTDSVAQMTIALLLELCLHVGEHSLSLIHIFLARIGSVPANRRTGPGESTRRLH